MTHHTTPLRGLPGNPGAAPQRLRRSIEQALAAHPMGLSMRGLIDAAVGRELAAGRERPAPRDVLTTVGMMVVSGRVDERDGLLVLRTDAGWGQRAA